MTAVHSYNFSKKRKSKPRRRIPDRKPSEFWSSHQHNIFGHVSKGRGHSVVLASPGSGKSTTIVESLFHIPKHESTLVLAFNNTVAAELTLRVPLGTDARTFHSFGLDTVRKYWGEKYDLKGRDSIDKDSAAVMNLVCATIGSDERSAQLRENIVWAVKMSKTMLADTVEDIEAVCTEFGISSCGIHNQDFANHVFNIMEITKREPLVLNGHRVISFDDMLWLPYVHGWQPKKYDRVFVDEAQDLSASRVNLTLKAMHEHGRLCAVGDRNQAIYNFSGASSGVIDKLIGNMNAATLPLSVSYRCPRKVVELAQDINPDIMAAPNAIEGNILHSTPNDLHKKLVPGKSVVISRNNFALLNAAFDLIRHNIKASVIGKDIGNRFTWRINNWMPQTVKQLETSVNGWRDEMCERNKSNAYRVNDEAESILLFTRHADTIEEVKDNIRGFFSESNNDQVKLSTCHKAKGLEWEHVYMLDKTFKPGKSEEEDNIYYVAMTRSKKSLTFVR